MFPHKDREKEFLSMRNRHNLFGFSYEPRIACGERKAGVTCEGRSEKKVTSVCMLLLKLYRYSNMS